MVIDIGVYHQRCWDISLKRTNELRLSRRFYRLAEVQMHQRNELVFFFLNSCDKPQKIMNTYNVYSWTLMLIIFLLSAWDNLWTECILNLYWTFSSFFALRSNLFAKHNGIVDFLKCWPFLFLFLKQSGYWEFPFTVLWQDLWTLENAMVSWKSSLLSVFFFSLSPCLTRQNCERVCDWG